MGGTSKIGAMVGVKHFVAIENGVFFQFKAKAKNKANIFQVVLDEVTDTLYRKHLRNLSNLIAWIFLDLKRSMQAN